MIVLNVHYLRQSRYHQLIIMVTEFPNPKFKVSTFHYRPVVMLDRTTPPGLPPHHEGLEVRMMNTIAEALNIKVTSAIHIVKITWGWTFKTSASYLTESDRIHHESCAIMKIRPNSRLPFYQYTYNTLEHQSFGLTHACPSTNRRTTL